MKQMTETTKTTTASDWAQPNENETSPNQENRKTREEMAEYEDIWRKLGLDDNDMDQEVMVDIERDAIIRDDDSLEDFFINHGASVFFRNGRHPTRETTGIGKPGN